MVIQRILRHANVSTTATYYIKTAADDVRGAMAKLETVIPAAPKTPEIRTAETFIIPAVSDLRHSFGTLNTESRAVPALPN